MFPANMLDVPATKQEGEQHPTSNNIQCIEQQHHPTTNTISSTSNIFQHRTPCHGYAKVQLPIVRETQAVDRLLCQTWLVLETAEVWTVFVTQPVVMSQYPSWQFNFQFNALKIIEAQRFIIFHSCPLEGKGFWTHPKRPNSPAKLNGDNI